MKERLYKFKKRMIIIFSVCSLVCFILYHKNMNTKINKITSMGNTYTGKVIAVNQNAGLEILFYKNKPKNYQNTETLNFAFNTIYDRNNCIFFLKKNLLNQYIQITPVKEKSCLFYHKDYLLNKIILEKGYAAFNPITMNQKPLKIEDMLKKAESYAKYNNQGIWNNERR